MEENSIPRRPKGSLKNTLWEEEDFLKVSWDGRRGNNGSDRISLGKVSYICRNSPVRRMIVDTMTKAEVMKAVRKEFDNNIYPLFEQKLYRYKAVADRQMGRSSKPVLVPRQRLVTSNGTTFEFDLKITREGYLALFYSSFSWNGRRCFAFLTQDDTVDVFQHHALVRYAERLLKEDSPEQKYREVFDAIAPKFKNCFCVVLPSPTHELTHYFPAAGALFLGDYDKSSTKNHYWHNTCISPEQMGASQSEIVRILNRFSAFNNATEINPFTSAGPDDQGEKDIRRYLKAHPGFEQAYVDTLKDELVLLSVVDEFDYPEIQRMEFQPVLDFLKVKIEGYGIIPEDFINGERQRVDRIISEITYRR